ncbi:MAG TPA: DUF4398 domain-containing protein [Thiobacillus sp.]|jgi:uncharacterized cupredoxin-like copper-binding protein|nr:DUF4398 domain-containing protein [Thiobacillus sp.]
MLNPMDEKMMKNTYSPKLNQMARRIGMAAVAVMLMAGCASTSAPTEQMAVSRAAVSNAMSAGGNQFAPVQLKSALDKMDAAERAVAAKDYELALRLAEQAEVDAKLAAEMARSAKAKQAADAVQEDIRVLRQEIDRQSK